MRQIAFARSQHARPRVKGEDRLQTPARAATIEEERRLLYVAMTRAREHLDLLIPQRFYVHRQTGLGDRHVYASRSRFLPDSLCSHFDVRSWPEIASPSLTHSAGRKVDLALAMRERWALPQSNTP